MRTRQTTSAADATSAAEQAEPPAGAPDVDRRVLLVTAVPAERDAVLAALRDLAPEMRPPRALPGGYELHRVRHGGPHPGSDAAPGAGPETAHSAAFGDGAAPEPPVVLDCLAAGVGPAAAAAGCATALTAAALAARPYDLVVSAGIGGGFPSVSAAATTPRAARLDRPERPGGTPAASVEESAAASVALGGTVVASSIVVADLGAETPTGFAPVTRLGFGTVEHTPPPALVRALAEATGAATGPVLTVSTVTGTAERAAELAARHPGAAAEAMEGFGVAEAAAAHAVPVLELRTVSNAVGPRDRDAWRIPDALAALGGACSALVPVLRAWSP